MDKIKIQNKKNIFEITMLYLILSFVIINAIIVKDNIIAVISALCGILYTLLAGKGRVLCYFFGLMGSACYSFLSFKQALFGNLVLYMCYYIPMQILGIFSWKKHLKKSGEEIIKTKLNTKKRLILIAISAIGSIITILILKYFNDSNPTIDGITTFMSVIGMYLTVKRALEQWIVWMIVNGLSFLMWIDAVIRGARTYSTVIMWGVYLIAAFYFYFQWKKELKEVQA